ncbi:CPBP family intramembrane glutamic endopeptidase [Alkalihalobacillus sp. R86527]|uniref:CPBP family intramembrane glutamic endopeptidase n=1 Tax=Alkalihalobacillus sp. R86527 TaxID=3093863 RepID=UPI00366B1001
MISLQAEQKSKVKEVTELTLFLLLAMGFSFVFAFVFGNIGFIVNSPLLADVFARIGQLLGLLGFMIIWYRNINCFPNFGLKIKENNIFSLLLLGLLLGMVIQLILFILFTNLGQKIYLPPLSVMSWVLKGLIPAIIIHTCVSVSEELLFRGYLLSKLQNVMATPIAVLIQGALFSLTHYFNTGFSILAFTGLLLFGVLMALLKYKSGSLTLPIAFHFMWNVGEGTIFGFPVSGEKPSSLIEVKTGDSTSLMFGGTFGPEESLLSIILLSVMTIIMIIITHSKRKKVSSQPSFSVSQS